MREQSTDTGAIAVSEIDAVLRGEGAPVARPALSAMSPAQLTSELTEFASHHDSIDGARLAEAIRLAAHLHRDDVRKSGTKRGDSPYIEHPLRNTVRLVRLGCTDESVLIASVLHDTVEDHPFDFVPETERTPSPSENAARQVAFRMLGARFGEQVAALVDAMSNDVMPADASESEMLAAYVTHVERVTVDPRVLALKVADLIDNAVGLYHGLPSGMSSASLGRRARKYLSVWSTIERRVREQVTDQRMPVSRAGVRTILAQLARGRVALEKLAQLH